MSKKGNTSKEKYIMKYLKKENVYKGKYIYKRKYLKRNV